MWEGSMEQIDLLKRQRERLKEDIVAQMDFFLIGTVAKSPSMTGHSLTTKVKGEDRNGVCEKTDCREGEGDDEALQDDVASYTEALQDQLGDTEGRE